MTRRSNGTAVGSGFSGATVTRAAAGFAITLIICAACDFPAAAQQRPPVEASPACEKFEKAKNYNAAIHCEIGEMKRRTDEAKERERQAKQTDGCIGFLKQGAADNKWSMDDVRAEVGKRSPDGKATPEIVCAIARDRGYGRTTASIPKSDSR